MSRHWSLRNLEPLFVARAYKGDDFNPSGDWDMSWTAHMLSGKPKTEELIRLGQLEVSKRSGDGELTLEVRSERQLRDGQLWVQEAAIRCTDALPLTVEGWSLESRLSKRSAPEDPLMVNAWEVDGPPRGPVSCDWALPDLVQRLSPGAAPEPFAMLECLEVRRERVVLKAVGEAPAVFKGEELTLRGWLVSGQGMIPSWCWLDPAGRLVAWTSVQRALVLKTAARA